MPKQTTNLVTTADHDAVLDQVNTTASDIGGSLLDHLLRSVLAYITVYNVIAKRLLAKANITDVERLTMTGGTFHGLVTGKKAHALQYVGKRKYPSSRYFAWAFLLHYLHDADRYAAYRETNSTADMGVYIQWLQIMFGKSTGPHCELKRSPEEIRKSFILTRGTESERMPGAAYAKCVKRIVVREPNAQHIPKIVSDATSALVKMDDRKLKSTAVSFDLAQWKDTAIAEMVAAGIAQLMLNAKAAKAAKAAGKAKVGASK